MSHKYLKKYMGKSGKWVYVYNDRSTSGETGPNKLSSVANNAQGALNKARAVIRSSSNSAKAKTGSSNIGTSVLNAQNKLGLKPRKFAPNQSVKEAYRTGKTATQRAEASLNSANNKLKQYVKNNSSKFDPSTHAKLRSDAKRAGEIAQHTPKARIVEKTAAKIGAAKKQAAQKYSKEITAFKTGSTERQRLEKQFNDQGKALRAIDKKAIDSRIETNKHLFDKDYERRNKATVDLEKRSESLGNKQTELYKRINNTKTSIGESAAASVGAKVNSVKKKKAKKQYERTHYVKQPDGSYVKKGRFGSRTVLRVGEARLGR